MISTVTTTTQILLENDARSGSFGLFLIGLLLALLVIRQVTDTHDHPANEVFRAAIPPLLLAFLILLVLRLSVFFG